jgi:O-antigen/teichoic acid export membrane protein
MKRIFISNLVLQLSLNLIIKPLYVFGVDRGVQNSIGKEAYGTYFSLLGFSYLLHTLNDFGIQNFTASYVAKHPHLIQKYFPNLLISKLLLSSLYFILTLSGALLLQYDWHSIHLLTLVMLLQITSSFLLFFRSNIAAIGQFQKDSLLSVLDRLLLLIVGFTLLSWGFFTPSNGAIYFVFLQIFAQAIVALIAYWILRQYLPSFHFRFNIPFLRYLFKKGLPYALIVFMMFTYTRSDVVLLERLLPDGKSEAGIYASAYRLLEAVNSVMLIFGTLLLPMFAGMIGRKEPIKDLLQLSLKIVLFLSITASLLVFSFKFEISTLLYKEATNYWSDTMGILFFSYIPLSVMYVLGSLLTASGELKYYNWLNFSLVCFSFISNYFLIPYYKAIGVAYISLATQSIAIIGLFYLNFRYFNLKIAWREILQTFAFVISLLAIISLCRQTHFFWLSQIAIIGIAAVLISFLLRFWTLQNIKQLLKK